MHISLETVSDSFRVWAGTKPYTNNDLGQPPDLKYAQLERGGRRSLTPPTFVHSLVLLHTH